MAMVADAYLAHAKAYYPSGNEYANVELATRPISDLYPDCMASKFGPTEYKACRQWWLSNPKRSRQYVNKMAKRLVAIIKWAVAEGMMPVTIHQTIKCVEPLRQGRVSAPESKRIVPVDDLTVTKTIEHCTQVVGDMIRLQLLPAISAVGDAGK